MAEKCWTDEILQGMRTGLLYCPVCDKTYKRHMDARNCCKPAENKPDEAD